nr:hypothetical protein HI1460 - Haemophilus influenzae (strain Rd KW20) [Haemophilus influenzae]
MKVKLKMKLVLMK